METDIIRDLRRKVMKIEFGSMPEFQNWYFGQTECGISNKT